MSNEDTRCWPWPSFWASIYLSHPKFEYLEFFQQISSVTYMWGEPTLLHKSSCLSSQSSNHNHPHASPHAHHFGLHFLLDNIITHFNHIDPCIGWGVWVKFIMRRRWLNMMMKSWVWKSINWDITLEYGVNCIRFCQSLLYFFKFLVSPQGAILTCLGIRYMINAESKKCFAKSRLLCKLLTQSPMKLELAQMPLAL